MFQYYQPIQFAQIGRVDGGECDAIVKFPYPREVDIFKARVNTIVLSVDAGVKNCPALPQSERQAWNGFLAEWSIFAGKSTSLFGAYGEWVQTCTYSATLDGWIEKLKRYCTLPGPENIEPPNAINLVKWITVGAVVVGSVALLTIYAPEIKGALGLLKKK